MPSAVPREEGDPFPGKLADHVRVGRTAPWGFDGVLFVRGKAGHVVEAAASNNSYFSFHFETRRAFLASF